MFMFSIRSSDFVCTCVRCPVAFVSPFQKSSMVRAPRCVSGSIRGSWFLYASRSSRITASTSVICDQRADDTALISTSIRCENGIDVAVNSRSASCSCMMSSFVRSRVIDGASSQWKMFRARLISVSVSSVICRGRPASSVVATPPTSAYVAPVLLSWQHAQRTPSFVSSASAILMGLIDSRNTCTSFHSSSPFFFSRRGDTGFDDTLSSPIGSCPRGVAVAADITQPLSRLCWLYDVLSFGGARISFAPSPSGVGPSRASRGVPAAPPQPPAAAAAAAPMPPMPSPAFAARTDSETGRRGLSAPAPAVPPPLIAVDTASMAAPEPSPPLSVAGFASRMAPSARRSSSSVRLKCSYSSCVDDDGDDGGGPAPAAAAASPPAPAPAPAPPPPSSS
eukprot:Rhum_TRINITY_DN14806_c22_g1::Rhum_TRINITY_DN14806_c22_g1_i1::g.120215::m.120215